MNQDAFQFLAVYFLLLQAKQLRKQENQVHQQQSPETYAQVHQQQLPETYDLCSKTVDEKIHTFHISGEEYIIKIENESEDKASNTGVLSQSAEPKLQHYLVTVKRERGDRCDSDNALLETTKNRNNSADVEGLLAVGDVSTEAAKDLMKHLRAFRQDDLYEAFGRYVATALRSMPEQRAQRLQLRIVRLLAGGEGEDS